MSKKHPTEFERRWRTADARIRQALNAPTPDPLFADRVIAAEDQLDAVYAEEVDIRREALEKANG